MPENASDIIKFRQPVLGESGATDFGLRMLIVDTQIPLVKMLLQEVTSSGQFVENGKTVSVRHEGDQARAFLSQQAYAQVLQSLPNALVAGPSLPGSADVVPPENVGPAPEPAPEPTPEPTPPETPNP